MFQFEALYFLGVRNLTSEEHGNYLCTPPGAFTLFSDLPAVNSLVHRG